MSANEEHDAAYSQELADARARYKGMPRSELLECQRKLRTQGGMPTHYQIASLEVLHALLSQ